MSRLFATFRFLFLSERSVSLVHWSDELLELSNATENQEWQIFISLTQNGQNPISLLLGIPESEAYALAGAIKSGDSALIVFVASGVRNGYPHRPCFFNKIKKNKKIKFREGSLVSEILFG